jgi:hypothetical protein
MCENKKVDIETFEHTVVHELVHAYDVCRAKIDFKNCAQHACTEIRASTLSGECGIIHDLARGHFKLHGGREDCVKRRATVSVEMNPSCAVSSKIVLTQLILLYQPLVLLREKGPKQSKLLLRNAMMILSHSMNNRVSH